MVWKATVSPYQIILRVTIVWIQEKDFSWIILSLCTNVLDTFFIIKYICLFLTVKVSAWGKGGQRGFFSWVQYYLSLFTESFFCYSFPPSFSWQNKIQGLGTWELHFLVDQEEEGVGGGRGEEEKKVGGEGGELLVRQQLTLFFNL